MSQGQIWGAPSEDQTYWSVVTDYSNASFLMIVLHQSALHLIEYGMKSSLKYEESLIYIGKIIVQFGSGWWSGTGKDGDVVLLFHILLASIYTDMFSFPYI